MKVIKVICESNARPRVKRRTPDFMRMREIAWSVKGTLNVLLQSFSPTSIYCTGLQKLSIYPQLWPFSATFVLHFRCKFRHRRSIRRPRFPVKSAKFWRFCDVFRWFLHFIRRMSAIFLLPVCLTYWPRKYTTRVDPHIDNSHQVWSWNEHTLPSYSVLVCRYITWPWPLTFWYWTVVIHGESRDQPCHQVWRPYAYPFLSYEL